MTITHTLTGTEAATRSSTLAKALSAPGDALTNWAVCTTLSTIAARATLRDRLALLGGHADWREFKDLAAEAKALRGTPEADEGTSIHAVIAAIVEGRDVSGITAEVQRDARAALAILAKAHLEPIACEQFGVTLGLPELVAGTCDMYARSQDTGDIVTVDFKTTTGESKAKWNSMEWSIQLACYSRALPYPTEGLARDRWDRPIIDKSRIQPRLITPAHDIGYIVEVQRMAGKARLHPISLEYGWMNARLACDVRRARKTSTLL